MASKYVIWERTSASFIGSGGQPLLFDQSADASAQIVTLQKLSQRAGDQHRKPLPTFDVVTVTV